MKKIVFKSFDQVATLTSACQMIKEGNSLLAEGKKKSEAGKEMVARWLESERKIKLDELPIGSIILCQGGEDGFEMLKLEVKGKKRLDQASLQLQDAAIFQKHYKEFPEKNYSVLVDLNFLETLRGKLAGKLERGNELKESLIEIASGLQGVRKGE